MVIGLCEGCKYIVFGLGLWKEIASNPHKKAPPKTIEGAGMRVGVQNFEPLLHPKLIGASRVAIGK